MSNTMIVTYTETYSFASAHSLPTFPEGHKCRRVHGHVWDATLHVKAETGERGYAFDHADLDLIALKCIGPLNHQYLNEIEGLESGLAEDILKLIVAKVSDACRSKGYELTRVDLTERSAGSTLRSVSHTKTWTAP